VAGAVETYLTPPLQEIGEECLGEGKVFRLQLNAPALRDRQGGQRNLYFT